MLKDLISGYEVELPKLCNLYVAINKGVIGFTLPPLMNQQVAQ